MKTKTAVLVMLLAVQSMGCSREEPSSSHAFEMRVDKVEELNGVILRGIAISGTVKNGCIGTRDEFSVKRDGEDALKEIARILAIADAEPAEGEIKKAAKGDYVTLYIPDAKPEDVRRGDLAASDTISCK